MTIEPIKNIKSGRSDLRKFGITVGIVLGLLGGLLFWREKDSYLYFLMLSAAFLLLGLVVPILLKPIHKVWMTLAVLLGWITTRIILSILFYILFTAIGLLAMLSGKDFLNIRFDSGEDSYWIRRKRTRFQRDDYERQF